MTTIITRSALEFYGQHPAADVARVVVDAYGDRRVVTWSEALDERRKRQRLILDRARRGPPPWQPYKLWVAYYDMTLFGGWQAFIENRAEREWIDRDCSFLIAPLLRLFPLVLALGTQRDQWHQWKVEFARQFARREHDRRPLGVATLWWNGLGDPPQLRSPDRGPSPFKAILDRWQQLQQLAGSSPWP